MTAPCILTLRQHLTEVAFCDWVGRASPGETLEYHLGFLAVDIEDRSSTRAEQTALRQLARRAAWASDRGLVHLVQRRLGSGLFSYLAIRRSLPRAMRRGGQDR